MLADCIRRCQECTDLCILFARFMQRDSEFAMSICEICAEAYEKCAAECSKHNFDQCKKCEAACLEYAEACRKMAT